jgi:hypothetical protein
MMALVSECGQCQTPIRKTFSRAAYEHGLVLVTCPGCQVRHLIADNLGWMGDQMTRERGEPKKIDLSTLYGDRLKTGTLSPGGIGEDGKLKMDDLSELVEGLTEEEMLKLFAKATQRKH